MKRWIFISTLLLLSASLSIARETFVHNVDITVRLDRSGTAHITEIWDVDVQTGTEWYLVQGNLGAIEIRDLAVSDETGKTYLREDVWDTHRTIEAKAGRCGLMHKGDGDYEICWGTGSYGHHRFTVSYTMTHFVKGLSDANAFNHQFVAEGLSSPPQHVRIVIEKTAEGDSATAFTPQNTGVWAFGFEGDIHLVNGQIVAQTRMPLDDDESVIVMARFDNDLFMPTDQRDESFEVMKNRALEGSSYKEGGDETVTLVGLTLLIGSGLLFFIFTLLNGSTWKRILYTALLSPVCMTIIYFSVKWWEYLLAGIVVLFVVGAVVYVILELAGVTSARPVYGVRRVTGWCRDIPLGGDLIAAHYVLNEATPLWGRSEKHLIEALLLRFIHLGLIRISQRPDEKRPTLSFGDEKPFESEFMSDVEYRLYKIMRAAAGKDLILQPHEFSKWAKDKEENGMRLYQWIKATKTYGEKTFDRNGAVLNNRFTRRGREMARTVPEFRNYLNDFSLINERQAREVALWDDYLTFASLFGIADKVENEFKALSPEYFRQKELTQGYDRTTASIMSRDLSGRFVNGSFSYKAKEFRASGGGGFVSLGGGGGHTGGGRGGGAR